MLRHHIFAALRAFAANRLLSLITVFGLAIGLTGAILMGLIARNALSFNDFLADHDRIYLGVSKLSGPGMPAEPNELTSGLAAPLIAANLPMVEAIGRLAPQWDVSIRRGAIEAQETIHWGDPGIFALLQFPVLTGDAKTALDEPDGLVLTASAARRWFGTAEATGRRLTVAGQTMTVRAVLADPPPQRTDLDLSIIASGRNAQSVLAKLTREAGGFSIDSHTYIKLRPGAEPGSAQEAFIPLMAGLLPAPLHDAYRMDLVRIDEIALDPGLNPGARDRLVIGTLIVLLVLFIATSNFVNLSLALSSRRHREIGVRKANGASRRHIALQFLGEAVLAALVAAVIAVAASEWLLEPMAMFLDADPALMSLYEAEFLLAIAALTVLLGLLAGLYPALIVSKFRPALSLKPGMTHGAGSIVLRNILVGGQFAILIALLVVTAVIHQQRTYATSQALRVPGDQMMMVRAACPRAFVDEVAKLPGVDGISCSGDELLTGAFFAFLQINGRQIPTDYVAALPSLFALYDVPVLAGSVDRLPPMGEETASRIVINETAVRRFGFANAEAAVGKTLPVLLSDGAEPGRKTIAAVVRDFSFQSVEKPIKPTIYFNQPAMRKSAGMVSIRLSGRSLPETVDQIDRLWSQTGQPGVIDRFFLSAHMEELYRGLTRNTQLFAIFSGLAVVLACLGLIGLALAASDRRIKEIGVRKAMGASTGQIMKLLLWQFSKPVLAANLVAWPIVWFAMRWWLSGFAYHVPLNLYLFPLAGVVALGVALLAMGTQSYLVARQKPVTALRYE